MAYKIDEQQIFIFFSEEQAHGVDLARRSREENFSSAFQLAANNGIDISRIALNIFAGSVFFEFITVFGKYMVHTEITVKSCAADYAALRYHLICKSGKHTA